MGIKQTLCFWGLCLNRETQGCRRRADYIFPLAQVQQSLNVDRDCCVAIRSTQQALLFVLVLHCQWYWHLSLLWQIEKPLPIPKWYQPLPNPYHYISLLYLLNTVNTYNFLSLVNFMFLTSYLAPNVVCWHLRMTADSYIIIVTLINSDQ